MRSACSRCDPPLAALEVTTDLVTGGLPPRRRRGRGWRSTTGPSRGTPSRAGGRRTPCRPRMAEPWFDPDGFPAPRARTAAWRGLLLDQGPRATTHPRPGRDLRDRRRPRLGGRRAWAALVAGLAPPGRPGPDRRRCSTSTRQRQGVAACTRPSASPATTWTGPTWTRRHWIDARDPDGRADAVRDGRRRRRVTLGWRTTTGARLGGRR